MSTFIKPSEKKAQWYAFAYCLLIAFGCMLICSKSSPLYPINDWSDANIYFSMGKGMATGRVLYRDIYDHKGPLLYALHALCYLVSPLSFLGVFFMEVISFALFLMSAWKLQRLYGASNAFYLVLPVLALLVLSSLSFQQGDSAEELCLPLLSWPLYALLAYLKTGYPKRMRTSTLLWSGLFCGCVLWIKFTMLGLFAAWILVVFLSLATRRQWKDAWVSVLWFSAGVALATLPWLLYFGVSDAVLPWLKTYLYDNLFLYSGAEGAWGLLARGKAMVKSALDWYGQNLRYAVPVTFGLLWMSVRKTAVRWEKLSLWAMVGVAALGVFIGGKSYLYYGLILAAFTPVGFAPISVFAEKRIAALFTRRALCASVTAAMCVLSILLCYPLSPNTQTTFLKSKEDTMQYKIAAVIAKTPGATLLNYGFMDAGFFTATGIVPNVKYFHQTNVPLQEMLDEQARYVREGLCDYVVTRGNEPESITQNYELIAEEKTPEGFWYEKVYLYRLRAMP